MNQENYYIYILASQRNGTLYIGITNNIARRVWEHRQGLIDGFTKEYHVTRLVYYEHYDHPQDAIEREKRLKKWKREWKLKLIKEHNPEWKDLYGDIGFVI